jgi:hypothetical protein
MGEHFIEGFDHQFDAALAALGFTKIGAFASKPEDDKIGAEDIGDVDGAEGTIYGVLAVLGIVAGVGTIDGLGAEPEAWGDHFGFEAHAVETFAEFFSFLDDLSFGFVVDVGNGVVVVKHHGVKAHLLELIELPIETLRRAGRGTVWVLTFADVPRTKAKFVAVFLRHKKGARRVSAESASEKEFIRAV